jgi:hypothetical protein
MMMLLIYLYNLPKSFTNIPFKTEQFGLYNLTAHTPF